MARVGRRKLIFTDETGFDLTLTRAFGRASRGERGVGHVPFNRGANYSLIGSLGLRGMVASLLLRGSVEHLAFDAFVTELLLTQLRAGDVLLLDNLPAHGPARSKRQRRGRKLKSSGCSLFGRLLTQ